MQRKELLKGKVYRDRKQQLVRVLDTGISPCPAEAYDFLGQRFVPVDPVHPRDIYGPVSQTDPIGAYESLLGAHAARKVLAHVDAFNDAFGNDDDEVAKAGSRRSTNAETVKRHAHTVVKVHTKAFGRATETLGSVPTGEVTMDPKAFVAWVQSLLGSEVPTPGFAPGTSSELYPGLDDALLTPAAYESGVAERQVLGEQRRRRWEITREVRQRLASEQPDLKGIALRTELDRLQREQCEAEGVPFTTT